LKDIVRWPKGKVKVVAVPN